MMMTITHYGDDDDDDDDDAPNAISWNYAMRPTKTTNLWSVHQTKQWDLLSTSESPRFCKWIYSPYYFCTALPPPILSRAVRPRALIGKKNHVSIQRLGAFLQCLDGSRAMWKKCGITIGIHIMFVGSVENFMMLHFTYGCAFSMLWWQPIKINMKTYVHKLSWGSFYDVAFPGVLMAVTIYINKRLNQNLFRCVRMFNSKMWTD